MDCLPLGSWSFGRILFHTPLFIMLCVEVMWFIRYCWEHEEAFDKDEYIKHTKKVRICSWVLVFISTSIIMFFYDGICHCHRPIELLVDLFQPVNCGIPVYDGLKR